ncbi:hypothetical protein NHB34_08730 [Polynucleobacter sp. MWH-UH19D]|uniref:hypothetical protein n=1 Tax=Polynucleobacter sp. MWH-UH19D TaxID=1855610 RepID=UPI003364B3C5
MLKLSKPVVPFVLDLVSSGHVKAHINNRMRFYEFKPTKPLTPSQARINSLKRNAQIAKQALDTERKAQQIQKAQAKIKKLSAQKVVL